jgi:hypothetical protein
MAHAQKPDFVFQHNRRVHLNRQGASVQSNTGSRVVRISGSNAGYTMSRGSVKGTGYPLQSPVSPSLPLPCVIVCHHLSTGLYYTSLLFCTITNKCTINTITVYITTVSLYNLQCYMFRHFPLTIRQFTANRLLSYTSPANWSCWWYSL